MQKISLLLCALLLSACAGMPKVFGEKVSKLEPGMHQEQVVEMIGRPDNFEKYKDGTIVKYSHQMMSTASFRYADYYLVYDSRKRLVSVNSGNIIDKTGDFHNALDGLNNNLMMQQQLRNQQNQNLMNSLNQNRAQRVIICKQGDLMCY